METILETHATGDCETVQTEILPFRHNVEELERGLRDKGIAQIEPNPRAENEGKTRCLDEQLLKLFRSSSWPTSWPLSKSWIPVASV